MKRLILRMLITVMIISFGSTFATAATLNVPGDYATIQAAINAASDGDIIQIAEGTYTESLNVGKSLTFIGSGPAANPTTIITTTANPMISLSVTGKSFSFQNLIIEGNVTNNGIRANSAIDIVSLSLQDVIARNCQVALYMSENYSGGTFLTTAINTLTLTGVTFTNNKFIGAYIGKTVVSGTVTNSTFSNNGYSGDLPAAWQKVGLQFVNFDEASVPNIQVTNCIFTGNGTGASNIERTGLSCYTAYDAFTTIPVMTVTGCDFQDHPQYAVRIKNGYNVGNTATVNGTFTNNWLDIWFNNIIGSTSSTTLVRNTFSGIKTVGPGPTYDFNTIQAAINAATAGNTVKVADGTYTENVTIDKSLTLESLNGKDVTAIQGVVASSLGTIYIPTGINDVTIGGSNKGFHIIGVDNPNPAIEWSAIYLQGAHTSITIDGNEIEAGGESGLMGEWNAALNNISINNNIFSGKTFVGTNPAGSGFGSQWTTWNVPRQFVALGGGEDVTNSFNVVFTNNHIIGTAGGYNTSAEEQGNTLVTIDVIGAAISGNTFNGVTTRYSSSLRVRGYATTISGNTFLSNGLTSLCNHLWCGNGSAIDGSTNNTLELIANDNTFDKGSYITTPSVSQFYINPTIGASVYMASTNQTVKVFSGTYTEQIYLNKEGLILDGAGISNTIIKSPVTLTQATSSGKKPVVFIDGVNSCTVKNLTVDGDGKGNTNNSFVGIGFWNAGGSLENIDVTGVRDTPFSGTQHGVGVYASNNNTGSFSININDVDVADFQKNAFALSGTGVTVTLNGVDVTGAGSTSVTAQNGIQIGFGADGTVTNSTVTGIHYVDNVPPVDWTATAVLLYEPGTVNFTGTSVTNSQTNFYFIDASGSLNNCSVTNPVSDIWANGVDIYTSPSTDNSGSGMKKEALPMMEDYTGNGNREASSVTVNNCTLTGNGFGGNYAIGVYAEDAVALTVTNSTITGWDYAISNYEDGGTITSTVNQNDLSGNAIGFYYNGTTWQGAEDNWWGHLSGPLDDSEDVGGLYNPFGEGSAVSDFVDYDPWYTDATMTIQATSIPTGIENTDQGVYYLTVQDAINAAEIGDVIQVTGDHNVKDIVVNKGLKIAAGAGGAHFNGLGLRGGTGITVNTTEAVEFNGVTFENYDIAIDFVAFGSASITNCTFINNVAAVNNQTTTMIPAEGNYWGHASGPEDDSPIGLYNPNGQGGDVTDYVDYHPWYVSTSLDVMPVDIAIYNPSCGHFQVKAKPNSTITNGSLTNIVFAVKWEAVKYPGTFINIVPSYGIDAPYYVTSGASRYAVFMADDAITANWTAGTEYLLVEFDADQSMPEGTVSDFEIANDAWAYTNYAVYYMENWGSEVTGAITAFADDAYLADCDLQLHAKVFLQGPYNTTTNLMDLGLNTTGYVFSAQPFNTDPWNYAGTESLTTIPTDMVDWVLVELRATPAGTPIRQAGLLFKDGTIKSAADPLSDIYFTGEFMPNADYYVAIFHRNHMPVMSVAEVNIPNAGSVYDLSVLANAYGGATAEILLETGVYGMIAGDFGDLALSTAHTADGILKYSGGNNDRSPILTRIVDNTGSSYINGVTHGNFNEDLTMNSWTKYSGSGNDQRLIILNLIALTGTNNLTSTYASLVPAAGSKAPYVVPGNGPIDIALVENNTSLDVVLVNKESLGDTWADNIQFTLSWDVNNVMMDQVALRYTGDYKLEPQGDIVTFEGRNYLTYAVVDYLPLPVPFNAGDKVTVLSLDKGSWAGTATKAAIAQDSYTLNNNGDYYISLIGEDKTGQLLTTVTGIDEPVAATGSLQLYPNPVSGSQVTLSMMPSQDDLLTLTVTDVSSRVVFQQSIQVSGGTPLVKVIGVENLQSGAYLVRLQGARTCQTGKLVVR